MSGRLRVIWSMENNLEGAVDLLDETSKSIIYNKPESELSPKNQILKARSIIDEVNDDKDIVLLTHSDLIIRELSIAVSSEHYEDSTFKLKANSVFVYEYVDSKKLVANAVNHNDGILFGYLKDLLDELLKRENKLKKKVLSQNQRITSNNEDGSKSIIDYISGTTIMNGIAEYYYESGTLKSEMTYSNGKLEGIKREYRENGCIWLETHYENGVRNGLEKEYDKDGNLESETPFINDKKHGIAKEYYKSGEIYSQIEFSNGLIVGISISYYKSGAIRAKTPYKNGLVDGTATTYYESGSLEIQISYQNGKKHGEYKSYYESGVLKSEGTYKQDIICGIYKEYDENGSLITKEVYAEYTKEAKESHRGDDVNLLNNINDVIGVEQGKIIDEEKNGCEPHI